MILLRGAYVDVLWAFLTSTTYCALHHCYNNIQNMVHYILTFHRGFKVISVECLNQPKKKSNKLDYSFRLP